MLLYRVSLLLLLHGMSGLVKASDKNSGLVFESQLVQVLSLSLSLWVHSHCMFTHSKCLHGGASGRGLLEVY